LSARPPGIPDDAWAIARAELRLLDGRSDAQLARIRAQTARFLASRAVTGVRGLEVDDRKRVLVAALAAIPLAQLPFAWLGHWHEVVLYPGQFRVQRTHHDSDTDVVTEWDDELAGEAWSHGPLILSWADIEQDLKEPWEGFNVVIHEIAHKIDMADGDSDGIPPLPDIARRREWKRVMTAAYAALCAEVDAERETALDAYAAESEDEFFAVCTEYYFSAPDVLAEHYPDVHAEFAKFYGPVPLPPTAT
jgi:Mlc titration factor MtfA (ptsG expression regulator)